VSAILASPTLADLKSLVGSCERWAFDLETTSAVVTDPDFRVVGLGLANEHTCFYVHVENLATDAEEWLKEWLHSVRLTCFNALFDGAAVQRWTGRWPKVELCSYGLFKQLSNEGHPGQRWNLATAQLEVLGWPTSNKTALEEALAERGLGKASMSQLPVEILGPYCASDADAAWQLQNVLLDVIDKKGFKFLLEYHTREFLTEVRLLAEQQFNGILVDREKLTSYHVDLRKRIDAAMSAFLTHPEVAHHIAEYEAGIHAQWAASAPPRFLKDGVTVAKRWESWKAQEADLPRFNPNSKQMLEWLFYEQMGHKPKTFTETGRRSVDRKVLPTLGEAGKLLSRYNLLVKERGYVEAWLEASATGVWHPQFNSCGTVTGRLSGSGGTNAQQLPKSRGFLECFRARPGHKLVELDFTAIEPKVLADFSRDANLLKLYGPDAPANDVYLWLAAKIPELAKEVCKYYDPDAPTPMGIAAAKKHCKRDRAIAKKAKLSWDYGAGAPKLHAELQFDGIEITLGSVRKIHATLGKLFAGIKAFEQRLLSLWEANGGWIPNISGRPLAIPERLKKDIVNRIIQSSAHDVLQVYLYYVDKLRTERGVPMVPWIVDFHDQTIFEVPEERAAEAAAILTDAVALVNQEFGFYVPMSGEAQIVNNLADIKTES
jgi:DNA polymerase I-like protein with 3'-5' exonuclease and polymerase domains